MNYLILLKMVSMINVNHFFLLLTNYLLSNRYKMEDKKTLIILLISFIVIFLVGLYVGKKTVPTKTVTVTKYIKGEPIHDTIPPIIIKETKPIDTLRILEQCIADGIYADLFPEKVKHDTIYFEKEDTTKILEDWATIREYKEELFDSDTLGTMILRTSVQYNRLNTIYYDFTPIYKEITNTTYLSRKYLPYIGVGISSFPSYNAEVGLFFNQSFGLSINANYYPNKYNYEYIPKYDFGLKVLKMF